MTPSEIKEAIELWHISQRKLALMLGCDRKLVCRWMAGGAKLPDRIERWLGVLRDNPPPTDWKTRGTTQQETKGKNMKPEPMLWLDDHRGIYIPRDFAASFADRAKSVRGVSDDNWSILESGPDHEWYWEAWNDVCDRATVTDDNGVEHFVHQDGACWLVPVGMEWDDATEFFVWPNENDDDC